MYHILLSFHLLFPLKLLPFLCYCLLCCLFPALGTKGAASLLAFPEPSPPSFLCLLWPVYFEYTSRGICGCHHIQDVPAPESLASFSLPKNIPTLPHTRLQLESGDHSVSPSLTPRSRHWKSWVHRGRPETVRLKGERVVAPRVLETKPGQPGCEQPLGSSNVFAR